MFDQYINFDKPVKKTQAVTSEKQTILMTESTAEVVETIVDKPIEEIPAADLVKTLNESNEVVAKKTSKGIKVKRVLKG